MEAFKADEGTAKACVMGQAHQCLILRVAHRDCALEQAVHAAHCLKEFCAQLAVGQQIVIQEIQMAALELFHLHENPVNLIGIEGLATLKKGAHIAKVAGVWTAARDEH